jgi:hypothetical protein
MSFASPVILDVGIESNTVVCACAVVASGVVAALAIAVTLLLRGYSLNKQLSATCFEGARTTGGGSLAKKTRLSKKSGLWYCEGESRIWISLEEMESGWRRSFLYLVVLIVPCYYSDG